MRWVDAVTPSGPGDDERQRSTDHGGRNVARAPPWRGAMQRRSAGSGQWTPGVAADLYTARRTGRGVDSRPDGGVAQSVRAAGLYPAGSRFESWLPYQSARCLDADACVGDLRASLSAPRVTARSVLACRSAMAARRRGAVATRSWRPAARKLTPVHRARGLGAITLRMRRHDADLRSAGRRRTATSADGSRSRNRRSPCRTTRTRASPDRVSVTGRPRSCGSPSLERPVDVVKAYCCGSRDVRDAASTQLLGSRARSSARRPDWVALLVSMSRSSAMVPERRDRISGGALRQYGAVRGTARGRGPVGVRAPGASYVGSHGGSGAPG